MEATMDETGQRKWPAANWTPYLGPLGYVFDQLPAEFRAAIRDVVGRDPGLVLGFDYAIGLAGIGVVIAVDPDRPVSSASVKTHIRRRSLPVMRPMVGEGFASRGKLISPLCRLLAWRDIYVGGHLSDHLKPLSRDEVR